MRDERVFVFGEVPGVPQRIWDKLTVSAEHFHQGFPCWEWQKKSRLNGYGITVVGSLRKQYSGFPSGKTITVHRLMYLVTFGNPGKLQVDHLCRNRACVNPTHLEAVTQPENLRRGDSSLIIRAIALASAEKTHCMRGHALSGYNLMTDTDRNGVTRRHCRECQRVVWREFARRKRAERRTSVG